MLRALRRTLGGLALLIVGYVAAAVGLGLVPANRDFVPAAAGIEIAVSASLFHADVILPIAAAGVDWAAWCPPEAFGGAPASHIAFGWGDRDFYLETRTLADLRPLVALKAVSFSTDTVLHVAYVDDPSRRLELRRVRVTPETYRRLADYIRGSFRTDTGGRPIKRPEPGYGTRDAFYDAVGVYSPLQTCNEWLAAGLRGAGIRTGWWAPLSFGITAHL
ncbi:MAG: TIGR02117 family protein [Proteobacteria bacterium]|nr:TIGR02117 family protein [Pseudomonadota bacterium]